MIDGIGIVGSIYHGALVIASMGSALIVFIYCWKTNRLNMDNESVKQMMKQHDEYPTKGNGHE
jgi:hypothetical protein